ncbi:hypothetical protein J6590_040353 [Homalodisca vitripennis]|nr:hypothetical protein J6590_040353 [Homalodisca vitripennis]
MSRNQGDTEWCQIVADCRLPTAQTEADSSGKTTSGDVIPLTETCCDSVLSAPQPCREEMVHLEVYWLRAKKMSFESYMSLGFAVVQTWPSSTYYVPDNTIDKEIIKLACSKRV